MQVNFIRHVESRTNTRDFPVVDMPVGQQTTQSRSWLNMNLGLTEAGKKAALDSARSSVPIAGMTFASRLVRAQETARLSSIGDPNIVVSSLIDERSFGELVLLSRDEIQSRFPDAPHEKRADPINWKPPGGGESFLEVVDRVARFVGMLTTLRGTVETVNCFTHDNVILAARSHLQDPGISDIVSFARQNPINYGAIYTFEL